MKKTFPVNINGAVFYIDEDAYNLLNSYIDQLRAAFPGQEGAETVDDIENRIAEIFAERAGKVITLDDVNGVIEQMGRPDDLTDTDSNRPDETTSTADAPTPPPYVAQPVVKRLYRDERNKVFGGVVAGLGLYLGWNVTLMRVLLVILALCTQVFPLVIVYMLAWMIIPAARTPRQILEMTGQPVTVSTIGQSVMGTPDPACPDPTPAVSTVAQVAGKVVLGIVGVIGVSLALASLILFVMSVSGLITYMGWGEPGLLAHFAWGCPHYMILACGVLCLSLAILIPSLWAIWAGCYALFNLRGIPRSYNIALAVVEVLLIIATSVLFNVAGSHWCFLTLAASASVGTPLTC